MGNTNVRLTNQYDKVVFLPPCEEGESQVVRHVLAKDGLLTYYDENVRSLYDLFRRSVERFPNLKCLGYRTDGHSPYRWLSYKETMETAKDVGSGFIALGCVPHEDKIGIFLNNCKEWVLAEQASNAYSFIVVPLYSTLGQNACDYIIKQAGMKVLLCSADKVMTVLNNELGSIEAIVQIGEMSMACKKLAEEKGIKLLTFEGLLDLGKKNRVKIEPPSPEEISTICYTSGTTGDPKGVILTHECFVAELAGAFANGLVTNHTDIHISYLPLAHGFERLVSTGILANGGSIGFYRGNINGLFDDIQALRPTIFPSVPRLYNKLYDKVFQAIEEKGGLAKTLFQTACEAKESNLKSGYLGHSIWDQIAFKKIKDKLGGHVRLMVTGSAPISSKVITFLRIAFSCYVLEGYGQTETCAGATSTLTCDVSPGHVGIPFPCNEMKLVPVEEMNYFPSDEPFPRGEICFRGPNCCKGYYLNEEKTTELIDKSGWLHTGDIGMLLPDGSLKIIDRKKNIFKLAQGEYIAPEKLENVYAQTPLIAQIFVHGESLRSTLVAIIVPDQEIVNKWAQEKGKNLSFEELCQDEKLKEDINKQLLQKNKESLMGFERIAAFELIPEPFSVENDLLTPTFKLKRNEARERFKDIIEKLYSGLQY